MPTHEHTINIALGEVLQQLRPHSWRIVSEQLGQLRGGGRPDILIEEASQWPVVIEAERANHDSAESDAKNRLGRIVNETRKPIESAIALVYPPGLLELDGEALRQALRDTDQLEYALLTRTPGGGLERLPESGWLNGSARDLAMLAHRASTPAPRVERMGVILEQSIENAAAEFTARHPSHAPGSLGADIAALLGQSDDQAGQTRRMAMTVIINALIFHEALAQAEFYITNPQSPPSGPPSGSQSPLHAGTSSTPPSATGAARSPSPSPPAPRAESSPSDRGGSPRRLQHLRQLLPPGDFDLDALTLEWQAVLKINYWPIFATAAEIIRKLPEETAAEVLTPLRKGALRLVQRGLAKSHDLTGVIFQRLIADRKFLATFYTRPAAAALLAGLAIPADRAPGGAQWGDEDTIAALQIGDFACGTGTLLSAAYQRIGLLHELHGGDPKTLHAPMMKHGLVGLDVLNIAVHLTAAQLAGTHPDVPFDGECLLTMPYNEPETAVGSLELLVPHASPDMIDAAAAVTAGGRSPENIQDLVTKVGHGRFDLVIMNPPFSRATSHEGGNIGQGSPAFAAFDTPREVQQAKLKHLNRVAGKGKFGNMRAGLGTHFVDLGLRKLSNGGTLALVLPTTSLSGALWQQLRDALRANFENITVVSVSEAGSFDRSFSADTGIAECLIVASDKGESCQYARFVMLNRQPASTARVDSIAAGIQHLTERADSDHQTEPEMDSRQLYAGNEYVGQIISAPLPIDGPWPIAGIDDFELVSAAAELCNGRLVEVGNPTTKPIPIPIVPVRTIAGVGFSDMEIAGDKPDGDPQGPFELVRPAESNVPNYPMLWNHKAALERHLTVGYDSEGRIKQIQRLQTGIDRDAATVWATATRAHYNRDLRFNSQSLTVAMTERKCIGGRAWPSVILHDPNHEYAFSLWCNSTLGLLTHWWVTNKSQDGRGTTTVTGIPNIPTLDTRALTKAQHAEAKKQFQALANTRFLPFDQIDEDPARAKLDRAILVNVLNLPNSLVAPNGPIDLIRRKLAQEPQIHGGKKSRVLFTPNGERSVKRDDRA